jgi:multicomponent K+:H+ antiporter subunit E
VTLLKKAVPAPLTSAALLGLWLALARNWTAGQVLLGLCLAVGVPILTSNLRPRDVQVRRPWVIARFLFSVGHDVILSNFQVAWGVVTWRWRRPGSKFVRVPLDLRDPLGLAALSMVTTVVPGTVWSELALDRSVLLLHVWDVGESERAFVARFKARYETPLREIFE